MRRWWICTRMIGLLFCISLSTVSAAPPPSAVMQAKQEAPLHVVGVVKADVSVRDESGRTHFTSETRKMTLAVQSVITNRTDQKITPGDTLDVYYFYYPPSEQVTGPARVSVMVGDQLEVWLKKDADGWTPVLAGDTVAQLKRVEPRREPEESPLQDLWRTYGVGAMLVVAAMVVGSFWWQKQNKRRVK